MGVINIEDDKGDSDDETNVDVDGEKEVSIDEEKLGDEAGIGIGEAAVSKTEERRQGDSAKRGPQKILSWEDATTYAERVEVLSRARRTRDGIGRPEDRWSVDKEYQDQKVCNSVARGVFV